MKVATVVLGMAIFLGGTDCPSQALPSPQSVAGPAGVTYSGGTGESCERAVKISGAGETEKGLAAEKAWVTARFPEFKYRSQGTRHADGRIFDLIEIETKEGERKSICFDITEFFGKW